MLSAIGVPVALSAQPLGRPILAPGADFCLARIYGARHLTAHPHQLVSAIRIMGRDAWRLGRADVGQVVATARISFRDRRKPLDLYGRCFVSPDRHDALRCDFVPDAYQDVLGQRITLRAEGARVKAMAAADWLVIRAGREPDGPYGRPRTDDAEFVLERRPFSACAPSRKDWTRAGPSAALIERLP